MTVSVITPGAPALRPARSAGAVRRPHASRVRVEMIDTPAARARRRGVLVTLILAAVAIFAPQAFASDSTEPPAVLDTYTVASGETVWSIATDLTPAGVDVREVVEDILTLNAMDSSSLMAGEQILLPEVG